MADRSSSKTEGGFALIISLLLLVVITLMATLLVINAANQSKVTKDSTDQFQTFLSADTGIEDALVQETLKAIAKGRG
mgnify:CR=1 FL=1